MIIQSFGIITESKSTCDCSMHTVFMVLIVIVIVIVLLYVLKLTLTQVITGEHKKEKGMVSSIELNEQQ